MVSNALRFFAKLSSCRLIFGSKLAFHNSLHSNSERLPGIVKEI